LSFLGFPVINYSLAIFNGVLLMAIPTTSFFIYLLLKQYGLTNPLAFIGAIIITLLSPQLLRITGHYSLSYGFFIPVLWLLENKLNQHRRIVLFSGIAILFTLLMSLLHVYFLGISMVFFGSIFLVKLIEQRNHKQKLLAMAYYYLPIIILPIVVFKTGITVLDFVEDRVEVPWGFLNYRTSYRSLFFSHLSPISNVYPKLLQVGKVNSEGYAYLGFMALPLSAYILFKFFKSSFLQKKIDFPALNITANKTLNTYIYAAFFVLLLAAAFPFYMQPFDQLVTYLTPIAQFRSPGRFAWIFYYIFIH